MQAVAEWQGIKAVASARRPKRQRYSDDVDDDAASSGGGGGQQVLPSASLASPSLARVANALLELHHVPHDEHVESVDKEKDKEKDKDEHDGQAGPSTSSAAADDRMWFKAPSGIADPALMFYVHGGETPSNVIQRMATLMNSHVPVMRSAAAELRAMLGDERAAQADAAQALENLERACDTHASMLQMTVEQMQKLRGMLS